jgi:ribosome-associated protein
MMKKKIQIQAPFITLGQLLKLTDCIDSGGQAKMFLMQTQVKINGESDQRRGRKCYPSDEIMVEGFGLFVIEAAAT